MEKAGEALVDFMRARKIINISIKIVNYAHLALIAFYKIKSLIIAVAGIPGDITSGIGDLKTATTMVGAAPGILDDRSHLPREPTRSYGGPDAPGIS